MTANGRRVVAVIPARGGSKGVPGKNLVPVGGAPLVVRSVRVALAATTVDRVVVSTDDGAIGEAASEAGATIVERPADLAGDRASSETALLHALDVVGADTAFDVVAFLQCTSPLTVSDDVDDTVGLVLDGGYDCALAVAPNHRFLWRRGGDGAAGVNHDPTRRLPRQELAPEFVETGMVYAMAVPGFRTAGHRFFGRIGLHVVDAARAIEIDDPADVTVARALADRQDRAARLARLPSPVGAVALDFDGVLTDNRVVVSESGVEHVICDRGDGFGIGLVRDAGIPIVVLSKERNAVVAARCRKLDVECVQALDDKVPALLGWLKERAVDPASCVYVGNDLNDLGCMRAVGCAVAVPEAPEAVRAHATIVLNRPGGRGAVRELCDLVLESEGVL